MTRHHLERQLDRLKKMVLSLGVMVEEAVHNAITAVQTRDVDLADAVVAGDKRIDEVEIDLEEECLHALALDQPVAMDLRFTVAVLKMNNDLERIGDLAVNIAEQAKFLASEGEVEQMPYDLTTMSQIVQTMLRSALDALVGLDTLKAHEVRRLDDEVDAMHRNMYTQITEAIRREPDQVEQMIHLLNISRQLERIADHAVNIAKDVLYMVGGDIVRHTKNSPGDSGMGNAG